MKRVEEACAALRKALESYDPALIQGASDSLYETVRELSEGPYLVGQVKDGDMTTSVRCPKRAPCEEPFASAIRWADAMDCVRMFASMSVRHFTRTGESLPELRNACAEFGKAQKALWRAVGFTE